MLGSCPGGSHAQPSATSDPLIWQGGERSHLRAQVRPQRGRKHRRADPGAALLRARGGGRSSRGGPVGAHGGRASKAHVRLHENQRPRPVQLRGRPAVPPSAGRALPAATVFQSGNRCPHASIPIAPFRCEESPPIFLDALHSLRPSHLPPPTSHLRPPSTCPLCVAPLHWSTAHVAGGRPRPGPPRHRQRAAGNHLAQRHHLPGHL